MPRLAREIPPRNTDDQMTVTEPNVSVIPTRLSSEPTSTRMQATWNTGTWTPTARRMSITRFSGMNSAQIIVRSFDEIFSIASRSTKVDGESNPVSGRPVKSGIEKQPKATKKGHLDSSLGVDDVHIDAEVSL